MSNKLIYATNVCGDWIGVYINGSLQIEGSYINDEMWLELVNAYNFDVVTRILVEDSYLDRSGNFPKSASDIPMTATVRID